MGTLAIKSPPSGKVRLFECSYFYIKHSLRLYGFLLSAVCFLSVLNGCSPVQTIRGHAMATTYTIQFVPSDRAPLNRRDLERRIEHELRRIEGIFSAWDKDSEISKLNASQSRLPLTVSEDLAYLSSLSLEIAKKTDGAFDPAIGELLSARGLGPLGEKGLRSEKEIQEILTRTGYLHIRSGKNWIQRNDARIQLNLTSIVDGYAADRIFELLKEQKQEIFLVEIGGELRASLPPQDRDSWNVRLESGEDTFSGIFPLRQMALSTSGIYRHRVSGEGKEHSHIINPRTGQSMEAIEVASVAGPLCVTADALSTAIIAAGPDQAIRMMKQFPGYEYKFVLSGSGQVMQSPGMEKIFADRDHKPERK